jgi:hypothetical protein
MRSLTGGEWAERFKDRFVRDTAKRVRFLMAAAARYAEPARFVEELRRLLREAPPAGR